MCLRVIVANNRAHIWADAIGKRRTGGCTEQAGAKNYLENFILTPLVA
jgi:hypothetical protein